jgi:hypothetical protein
VPSWPAIEAAPAPTPPSEPYKGCGPHPVLTAPIPTLLPPSLSSSSTTSEPLCRRRFLIIARPSLYFSGLGERRVDFTVLPSLHLTLTDKLPSSGAARGQAPVSMPPHSDGLQSAPPGGPWWTEPPAVHELWTVSNIISYCKIILKPENPHHLTNNPLYLSIIKLQSTFLVNRTLGFKNMSKYTPSHF